MLPFSVRRLGSTETELMTGGVLSATVKVVVQVPIWPAGSTAWTVTVCTPGPRRVPAAGVCVTVDGPLQLSITIAAPAKSGTAAFPSASTSAFAGAGQVTWGTARLPTTVKVVEHVLALPEASVTVRLIV